MGLLPVLTSLHSGNGSTYNPGSLRTQPQHSRCEGGLQFVTVAGIAELVVERQSYVDSQGLYVGWWRHGQLRHNVVQQRLTDLLVRATFKVFSNLWFSLCLTFTRYKHFALDSLSVSSWNTFNIKNNGFNTAVFVLFWQNNNNALCWSYIFGLLQSMAFTASRVAHHFLS